MQTTQTLNLKLPGYEDVIDIQDLNDNFSGIDEAIAKKADTSAIDSKLSQHNTDEAAHENRFNTKLSTSGGEITGDLDVIGNLGIGERMTGNPNLVLGAYKVDNDIPFDMGVMSFTGCVGVSVSEENYAYVAGLAGGLFDVKGMIVASSEFANGFGATMSLREGINMKGPINFMNNKLSLVGDPVESSDAATKGYVDNTTSKSLQLSGGTMTGSIRMGANDITGTATNYGLMFDNMGQVILQAGDTNRVEVTDMGINITSDVGIKIDGDTNFSGKQLNNAKSIVLTSGTSEEKISFPCMDTTFSIRLVEEGDHQATRIGTNNTYFEVVDGDPMSGSYCVISKSLTVPGLSVQNHTISGVADPTSDLCAANKRYVDTHSGNKSNPHGVSKAQVGLGNVDNTSDMNKPISTAMQNALNGKAPKYTYGTKDLTPGVSSLANGTLYFVYE